MVEEERAQRLAERIGRLEEEIRQLKKLIVQKYSKPWWKARSENVDFEQLYAGMLAEAKGKSNESRTRGEKRGGNPKRTENHRADRSSKSNRLREGA